MNGNRYLLLGLAVLLIAGGLAYSMLSKDKETTTGNDMMATTTASSTDAGTNKPTTGGVKKPTGSTASNYLVKLEYRGGVCNNNTTCYSYRVITKDAKYYKNGAFVSTVNSSDVKQLTFQMSIADYNLLRSKPFVGTCPTNTRQEIVYTFYTSHGEERISNCSTEIDYSAPVFKLIPTILPTNS